jgi:hypothetical protein
VRVWVGELGVCVCGCGYGVIGFGVSVLLIGAGSVAGNSSSVLLFGLYRLEKVALGLISQLLSTFHSVVLLSS